MTITNSSEYAADKLLQPNASVLPFTNENFYELSWRARNYIFDQLIQQDDNLDNILDAFSEFEIKHHFAFSQARGVDSLTGQESRYWRNQVKITKRNIQDPAAELKKQIKMENDRTELIVGNLKQNTQAVVELGCGYGNNLFRIRRHLGDRKIRLVGAEYTVSGRNLCAKLNHLNENSDMQIEFIDHKALNLDFLSGLDDVLIFTCHSIEQVKFLPEDYFRIIAQSASRVTCIHFEPFGFQIDNASEVNSRHQSFVHEQGWNLNFIDTLRNAEQTGILSIRLLSKDLYNPAEENPTSVAIWSSMGG